MPRDHPVFDLAERFVDAYGDLHPMEATFCGIAGHDHEWGDLGPDTIVASEDLFRTTRDELNRLPPACDRFDELALRTLRDLLDHEIERLEHHEPLRDLAHMGSTIPGLRDALDLQDISTPEAREAVLARLRALPAAMAGWCERMRLGLDRDVVVPARQVRSVVDQLHAGTLEGGGYPVIVARLAERDAQLADAAAVCLQQVRAASDRTARFLREEYLPKAPTDDAAGPAHYLRNARHMLGVELDPSEAYAWAWSELRGLLTRAEAAASAIDPDTNLAGVLQRLRTEPAFAAPSPTVFRDLMAQRQQAALDALAGRHFDVPPQIRTLDVRLAPPGGAITAYYIGPSEDFGRPGSVWWSLGDRQRIPLYEEVSTAYHEGFPGHHLQIGVQMTLSDRLSRAHRLLAWNPGYGEGWALYAETLMDELGMLEQPQYELGYLTSSILRTLRVVIDIGLHLGIPVPTDAPFHRGEPWTFDRAVDVLHRVAGLPIDYATSEVTRYLGWPAQAISYALGQRTILELREERRVRDGQAFDLRAFHADVLGSGPVGLAHLRELVLS